MQQEYKYIYQVYQSGSFSQAAKALFMTQPALSIAVQKIEVNLGQQLFDRSCHPLALTDAGKIYIEAIRKAQELEQELGEQLADLQNMQLGSLKIGGSHFLNAYILPRALAKFSACYPKIKLDLCEASSAQTLESLAQHELDLAFSCDGEVVQSFPHEPAFVDTILLAVNEKCIVDASLAKASLSANDIQKGRHLSDTCPSVTLDYFKNVEFILLTPENNLYERSMEMFVSSGVQPCVKLQVAQLATAYHLVENFAAAAFISSRLVTHNATKLRFFKLAYPQAVRNFYLLLPKRNYISLAVRTFIKMFQQLYQA